MTTEPQSPIGEGADAMSRRGWLRRLVVVGVAVQLSTTVGCGSIWKSNSTGANEALQSLMIAPKAPDTVGIGTQPIGLEPLVVVGVGAVNSLPATGGAPDPSETRDLLIDEMKRHDVPNCEAFLEQDSTALVEVEAAIPAGARRGDSIDVRVICPEDAGE